MRVTFEVRDNDGHVLTRAARHVRRRAGWDEVKFEGERYQLFGGLRTDYFIRFHSPIPRKADA